MKLTGVLCLTTVALTGTLSLSPALFARETPPAFLPVGERADAPSGFADMCLRNSFLCNLGRDDTAPRVTMVGQTNAGQANAAPGLVADPSILLTGAIVEAPPIPMGEAPLRAPPKEGPTPIVVVARPPSDDPLPQQELLRMLKHVNAQVNREIYPATDIKAFGVGEYWNRPTGRYLVGDCEDYAIEKRVRLMEMGFPASRLFYAVVYHRTQGLHTVLIARLTDGDVILDNLSPHILPWSKARFSWLRQQIPGQPDQWVRIGDWRQAASYARNSDATQAETG